MNSSDGRPKKVSLRRAGLLAALTTIILAAGYGFAVFALTRTGNAAVMGVGSTVPPGTSTFFTTTLARTKSKCNGHAHCYKGGGDTASDGVFLCYSNAQTVPGVWPEKEAMDLIDEGYWLPVAVPGNVEGGPNLGAYHLVCTTAGTTTPGKVVNANGELLDGSPGPGYYALLA